MHANQFVLHERVTDGINMRQVVLDHNDINNRLSRYSLKILLLLFVLTIIQNNIYPCFQALEQVAGNVPVADMGA